MRLDGPTLSLRLPAERDAPALFALGADPEVTRFFSWGPYADVAEPVRWLAEQVERRARGEALTLLVDHPEAGVVGVTELVEWSRRDRRAMVGTWLGRPWWGTGVNAAAKALVLALAFEHCGLARVGAYADVRNERSRRALERLGFTREGTLRAWHRHADVPKDVDVFGLLREEWRPVPAKLSGELPAPFR